MEVTIHNRGRARHRGGYWDLGDPGCCLLREMRLEWNLAEWFGRGEPAPRIEWIEEPGREPKFTSGRHLEIYQESSGGDNWKSRAHVNRRGHVPMKMRGYRVASAAGSVTGHRATPVVAVGAGGRYAAFALEEFWEQFPSAIEVETDRLLVKLWPGQFPDLFELQAGEKNTRVLWLQTGDASERPWQTLAEVHRAPLPKVDRDELHRSRTALHLPFVADRPRPEYGELLAAALTGERSFFAKREAIDEYGWRNFGDVWADHEQAHCEAEMPVISHYNNQYDLLHGFLVQYVLTGDERWWRLADPLARHLMDIDIYHTDRDKPAYNGGMFWHTAHYLDAATSTHRSMSLAMRGKQMPAPGGGPGNEHCYATGLLLYHRLTGNERARKAVLGLADWMICMDKGHRHVLGVFSVADTGAASATAQDDYHGPGRGAGNAVNSLLDGWLASGRDRYLAKAIELIRRTIHPADDIEARKLRHAELRWSYTVHLQSLFRFLELTGGLPLMAGERAYAAAALLHYARWMAEHERPFLEDASRLEYPNETWAAQDLRKGNVLLMAALHAAGAERERFVSRGRDLLDAAWRRLQDFETRTYTRPLALVLQQGHVEQHLLERLATGAAASPENVEFDPPSQFVPQRVAIRRSANSIRGIAGISLRMLRPKAWVNVARQLWITERGRRVWPSISWRMKAIHPSRDADDFPIG